MCDTTHQTANTSGGADNKNDNLKTAYEHLYKSYDAIDGFRSKLLGLLPAASASGIFLLLKKAGEPLTSDILVPIGLFGFAITLGFFAYELYGIRKCHAIILAAQKVEDQLGITGPFVTRPRELLGILNEPFAGGIIYPAVMAAWTFMGLYSTKCGAAWTFMGLYSTKCVAGSWAAGLVFLAGFVAMLLYNRYLKHDADNRLLESVSKRMLKAEEVGDHTYLEPLLDPEFKIHRADGQTYTRQQYLNDVGAKKNRGRSADQLDVHVVHVGWRKAVLTCRVTTTRDADGQPAIGHFKNTQQFLQRADGWRCTDWKVEEMDAD